MNEAPSVAQLRQCAELLNVEVLGSPEQLSDDPQEQRVLLSALVLGAAELRMLQTDTRAHHDGLTAAVEVGVTAPLRLAPDPHNLLAYLSWRLQRDALLLTHVRSQGLISGDDLMLTTAAAAANGGAHLLRMIHALV